MKDLKIFPDRFLNKTERLRIEFYTNPMNFKVKKREILSEFSLYAFKKRKRSEVNGFIYIFVTE